MDWGWLQSQVQTASPLVAGLAIAALAVVWREYIKGQKTILDMSKSNGEAMTATAIAMERLTSAVVNHGNGRRGR